MTSPRTIPPTEQAVSPDDLVNKGDPAILISLSVAALFGAWLLLTSTTDPFGQLVWRYDAKRMLQFGLLIFLFSTPLLNGRIRSELGDVLAAVPRWVKMTLLGIFAWGVVSVLFNARSPMQGLNSFSEVGLLTALVLGVFVIAACRRIAGRPFDRLAIGLIALTGLAVGIQELIGAAAAQNAGVEFNFRISLLHFSWPRFYNQVQSWAVPVLVALPLLFARYKLSFFLCALVLGLQWYILIMGAARGSVVSLGAAFVFALVCLPQIRARLVKWQATGLILGLLIYAVVLYSFEAGKNPDSMIAPTIGTVADQSNPAPPDNKNPGEDSSFFKQSLGRPMIHTSGRTEMWRSTLEDVHQHPVLGIGPMNYVCTSPKAIGHPHNFLLQLAAEWGLPVALAVFVLFLVLMWQSVRKIRQNEISSAEDNQLAGLLLTGIFAAACHANLSGVMVMPASQVTGLLLTGVLLGLTPGKLTPGKPRKKATRILNWSFVSGLALSIGLLVLGVHELRTLSERAVLLKPGYDLRPRIWQDSKVCTFYTVKNPVKN